MYRLDGERMVAGFWSRVRPANPEDCWIWIGASHGDGYGVLYTGRRMFGAHVFAWELANRLPVPNNHIVMHTCDRPRCVNPAHLRAATQSENILDSYRKRRRIGRWYPKRI